SPRGLFGTCQYVFTVYTYYLQGNVLFGASLHAAQIEDHGIRRAVQYIVSSLIFRDNSPVRFWLVTIESAYSSLKTACKLQGASKQQTSVANPGETEITGLLHPSG